MLNENITIVRCEFAKLRKGWKYRPHPVKLIAVCHRSMTVQNSYLFTFFTCPTSPNGVTSAFEVSLAPALYNITHFRGLPCISTWWIPLQIQEMRLVYYIISESENVVIFIKGVEVDWPSYSDLPNLLYISPFLISAPSIPVGLTKCNKINLSSVSHEPV